MEDNVFYSKGVLAESNAQWVERAARRLSENALFPQLCVILKK